MNSAWIQVKDAASGRIYYANTQTGQSSWNRPLGFNRNSQTFIYNNNNQPQHASNNLNSNAFYNPNAYQQPSLMNMQQQMHSMNNLHQPRQPMTNSQSHKPQIGHSDGDASKWQRAYDPSSGKFYWYHEDTKQTQWDAPAIISASTQNFNAVWGGDTDSEHDDDTDDYDTDTGSDDGLEIYNPEKTAKRVAMTSLVDDGASSDGTDDEKEQDIKLLSDDDKIVVTDTSNEYWIVGEYEHAKYPLAAYGEVYFQKNKHNSMFKKKCTVNDLLRYSPYNKMKHALKKMDSNLDKQAQQIWKNINSYMGLRKSSKSDSGHIDKILRFALKSCEDIRDEIYLQLIKQTNHNPSIGSLIKGWKLMSICCSIFPPSDQFCPYLASHLFIKTKEPRSIGQFAEYSLRALDRAMEYGQRRIQPLNMEIERIINREYIDLKVYLLDGTFRTLLVTSQTTAIQIRDALKKALRLHYGESFSLFEMEEPSPGWEKSVYHKRSKMERQEMIDNLQYMPYNRELEMNERVMDTYSSWFKSHKKKDRKIRFIFKCKLHSKAQENGYSKNEWKIAFMTVHWNVIHGLYPLSVGYEEDILHLAALQLQAIHGLREQSFWTKGIIQDVMDKYVPWKIKERYIGNLNELEMKILNKHVLYKHLDRIDGYRKYIEYLRNLGNINGHFGCSFFRCVRVSRSKKVKPNEIIDLLLGISENGVLFMHPLTLQIIERYKLEEILTYGFRANAFLFVAGTLMTQRRYQFATMNGKEMNDLLRDHIDLRVQQAEMMGYVVQQ